MKARVFVGLLVVVLAVMPGSAQKSKDMEKGERSASLGKPGSIYDRAGGVHNRSNIGIFFENRGKLYPRRANPATPSGEWPLKSGMEYIYRMNPFVGIPGNVIQGRWTTDEEWEAAGGYHNRDSAQVAFSDKPYSWPATGWPVKDAEGKPIFVSDQDSYCVYNDSNNTKGILNIQMNQTGYAFSLKRFENMIFFIYQIVNRSTRTYDSLYFGLYCDIDVGDVAGGSEVPPEYSDDKMGFNKQLQLVYFYDDGISPEWPGNRTGYFGATLIKTPSVGGTERGITDLHYSTYDDDYDIDSVQYGIMSSQPGVYASSFWGPKYFHLGANAPNLHFDDPATIPAAGMDILGNLGSGPYSITPGDTLTFVTAVVAGWTYNEIVESAQNAHALYALGYRTPRPPDPPKVNAVPGDGRITITWDNRSEASRDPFTGALDFQGYRVYKSIDKGQHWDQFDRNQFPQLGPNPVPLADYDKVDGMGPDKGLQYTYVDSTLDNGFEYWYTVTAYDSVNDPNVPSLESAQARNSTDVNIGVGTPRSDAIGRTPVEASDPSQSGTGRSNATWKIVPQDVPAAGDKSCEILFNPTVSIARGNLRTLMQISVDSVMDKSSDVFSLVFTTDNRCRINNLSTGRVETPPSRTYTSGVPIVFAGLRLILTDTASLADQRVQAGDSLVIRPGLRVTAGADEVLSLRPLDFGTKYASTNGLLVSALMPYPIRGIEQVAGTNPVKVVETVTSESAVPDQLYNVVFDSVWLSASGKSTFASIALLDSTKKKKISSGSPIGTGDALDGEGFTLIFTWDDAVPPVKGTTVQIRAVKQRGPSFNDRVSFMTYGAKVDQQKVANELSRIRVVPNPYLVSSLYEEEFGVLRREPIRQLKFINLPAQCTITIFTLDGDKVQTIEHASGDGTETWNMKGSGGREIAPGIYIYMVKSESAEKIDRFAVIK